MQVGAMNNPARPLELEVQRIAQAGFDFIDVTLEPPGAWPVTGTQLRRWLDRAGLPAIGHTAYYLPLGAPFDEVRRGAVAVFTRMFEAFARAGIRLVNVHPGTASRLIPRNEVRKWNADAIADLTQRAAARGLELMVENLPVTFVGPDDFREIFAAAPGARFHLDAGHGNIGLRAGEKNRSGALLKAFASRLAHVHVHDNLGGQDLHLPIGAGTTDWPFVIRSLKEARWNGTVTIEVFSPEQALVQQSRKLWLEMWAGQRPPLRRP